MELFSRLRSQAFAWWQDVPLPQLDSTAMPTFQSWHTFDASSGRWVSFDLTSGTVDNSGQLGARHEAILRGDDPKLVLVTWNVDAGSPAPDRRISAIISRIQGIVPAVDVVFLQEVSHQALATLLETPWIRNHWYCSEANTSNWGKQSFGSIALVSKSCFGISHGNPGKAVPGPVWRVKLPSRFARDALCCDIFYPSPSRGSSSTPTEVSRSENYTRIRLINVHLDSLPIQPSMRPRQLSIISSYLRAAGHGLVAGDFNPVLPEDNALVDENNLVDVWTKVHFSLPGFTWGVDGKAPFPPNRLDKVAVLGLEAHNIAVIQPGILMNIEGGDQPQQSDHQQEPMVSQGRPLTWSDHYGLECSLSLTDNRTPAALHE